MSKKKNYSVDNKSYWEGYSNRTNQLDKKSDCEHYTNGYNQANIDLIESLEDNKDKENEPRTNNDK